MTELTDPAVIARKAGWPRVSAAAATAVLARPIVRHCCGEPATAR